MSSAPKPRSKASPSVLRLGRWISLTEAEGPGARFAIWVQGCSLRCPGCCNPHLFAQTGGQELEVSRLLAEMSAVRGQIEGITLLGGEPFEQAEPLAELAAGARKLGLGVMTFTGYVLEELRGANRRGVRELLCATDLLVDGRYEASRPENDRRWAGSTNQRFHYLSSRYPPGMERIRSGQVQRTVELRIGPDGQVAVNGWPEHSLGCLTVADRSRESQRRG